MSSGSHCVDDLMTSKGRSQEGIVPCMDKGFPGVQTETMMGEVSHHLGTQE